MDDPGEPSVPTTQRRLREHLEVERTYVLPPGAALPELKGAPGVGRLGAPRVLRLDATYWDTADLRLAARRVRLRRRTGGSDAGWHLKAPADVGVVEVHAPTGRPGAVPRELLALTRSASRGAPLVPVVRIRTRRTERDLLDDDGRVVAVVADDDVSGRTLPDAPDGGQRLLRWRELEVELSDATSEDGEGLLDAVEQRLLAAGAEASPSPSKLGHALADDVPALWPPLTAPLDGRARTGDVLRAYLRAQVDALVTLDPLVRRDVPDAVHRMRVATRRTRSALRSYAPLLDRAVTDPLADRLKDLAAVLGGMRDREVLRERLLASLSDTASDLVAGPVRERVERTLDDDMSRSRRAALAVLDSPAHADLLEQLVLLAADPPWSEPAAQRRRAAKAMPGAVRRAHRRVARDLRAAARSADRSERDLALHDARKAAKRVRYAAEVLAPALGAPAQRVARRAEKVQALLGEHQDAVVARGVLIELGAAAHAAGESALTYGALAERERHRADEVEAEVPRAARRLAAAVEGL